MTSIFIYFAALCQVGIARLAAGRFKWGYLLAGLDRIVVDVMFQTAPVLAGRAD